MKLVPIGDRVVLQRVEADQQTSGGIVLPDAAKEKPTQGRVLSVGDGPVLADGRHSPSQVHEGDRVLFSEYAGTEVKVDGKEVIILRESDILAIIS